MGHHLQMSADLPSCSGARGDTSPSRRLRSNCSNTPGLFSLSPSVSLSVLTQFTMKKSEVGETISRSQDHSMSALLRSHSSPFPNDSYIHLIDFTILEFD